MAKLHRRAALLGAASAVVASLANAAETTQYFYDALGRVVRVQFNDGSTVIYTYDAAGNRSQVVRSATPPWVQTIAITGTAPVNLRTLANNAGYDGANNAIVTFTLASGVTITGAAGAPNGGIAIDSGTWPTATYAINLVLQIGGKVYGGGGSGGTGGGLVNGTAGGSGGDAITCRLPMSVIVNSGGEVKSGGGGGGGGGSRYQLTATWDVVGGGGGGGFPNGAGGPMGTPGLDDNTGSAANGSAGTTSGGGAGGAGENGSAFGVNANGGAGGAGGGAGASGVAGVASTGTVGTIRNPGLHGVAGYAIRKNANAVTVTNNGTITGTVG